MGLAIAHRGPDDHGSLLRPSAGFAFRRLSIIDVAGGHQPLFNEDGTVAIILNGEIYNHHQIRAGLEQRGHRFTTRSDVETVVHLFEEEREGCLRHLRGMFALAIWDERSGTLFLARDRLGKKPLYFARLPQGGIVFGSEIKAILQHPDVRREPDPHAIDQFLTLQYVPSPLTAFRGIERIPPGHWLRWRAGAVQIERYWRLDFSQPFDAPEPELRAEMVRQLKEAVEIRLESEVPLGAFLSGGVDSSAVVAFAAQALSHPLKTFSIGFERARFDESGYARMVAERFGTEHHELIVSGGSTPDLVEDLVWHYDQPFGDSSAIPSFHVARLTRPHVTVVLNGDGGDENFAGYDRYRLAGFGAFFRLPGPLRSGLLQAARPFGHYLGRGRRLIESAPRSPAEAYAATLVHLAPARRRWLYGERLAAVDDGASPPLAFLEQRARQPWLRAMLETDINHYLPDDLLVKMDVATMAYSLEARSPFLDHRFMEFMARVPTRYKLRGGRSKHLLKTALRGILPDPVLDRPKMGFGVPLGDWLRTSLKELLMDTVLSARALERGYVREGAVRQMVDEQLRGSNEFQYPLWDLLQLELWHRTFIDRFPAIREPLLKLIAG
jgi:asparagine synthase (glutamine-hydrolysing)